MNNSSPLSQQNAVPAFCLASGIKPQQKWPLDNLTAKLTASVVEEESKVEPKLIEMRPTQGEEGTIITVVVQALPPQALVKLAFSSLMVDTQQLRNQDIISLVATVPPLQQTCHPSAQVPVSICFLNKDMVTETWIVANFQYDDSKPSYQSDRLQTRDDNDFLNSAPATSGLGYPTFYSPTTTSASSSYGFEVPQHSFSLPYPYPYQSQPQRGNSFQDNKYTANQYSAANYSDNVSTFFPVDNNASQDDRHRFTDMLTCDSNQASSISYNTTTTIKKTKQPTAYRGRKEVIHGGYKATSRLPNTTVANYQPYPGLTGRTDLDLSDDLHTMTKNWTSDEWGHRRRLVQIFRQQQGKSIKCAFQATNISAERITSNSNIIVSCIYWAERNDFFITSVDCIYLLESLMETKFSVEEKNRVRRNLEGFRPLTVSKGKPDTAEFFKLVMSFPNPKPRNIEKDLKVFSWKMLPFALKKIVTKYTANTYSDQRVNVRDVSPIVYEAPITTYAPQTNYAPQQQPYVPTPATLSSNHKKEDANPTTTVPNDEITTSKPESSAATIKTENEYT